MLKSYVPAGGMSCSKPTAAKSMAKASPGEVRGHQTILTLLLNPKLDLGLFKWSPHGLYMGLPVYHAHDPPTGQPHPHAHKCLSSWPAHSPCRVLVLAEDHNPQWISSASMSRCKLLRSVFRMPNLQPTSLQIRAGKHRKDTRYC